MAAWFRDSGATRRACVWLAAALCAALAAPGTPRAESAPGDPAEPLNRRVFGFNLGVDRWSAEPVAEGWDAVSSEGVRRHLNQFFVNLRFPVRFVGTLTQGRIVDCGEELSRFVVNTTVGLGGFFDPASELGLELHDADFGQTLGRWGTPSGPYLVLPLLGPSSPRDGLGQLVDAALGSAPSLISPAAGWAAATVNVINRRTIALEDVREAREASLDFYTFARDAHIQLRTARVRGEQTQAEEPDDDLYDLPDED